MSSGAYPISSLKNFIKGIPLVGPTAGKLSRLPVFARARRLAFPGSTSFWEAVYREGGTSGPGSYGRLAEFKAEVLNEFVRMGNIRTVIEFGCGDGVQLQLAQYPEYVGVDVATASIERCTALFAHDATKRFYLADDLPEDLGVFDLVLSLDVIYHLVEDSVFEEYMRRLFTVAKSFIVIYASNYDALTHAVHVRHRKFTTWIAQNASDWQQEGFVTNRYPFDPERPDETSHADFYFFSRQPRSPNAI
jgi:cyclopropane fatty-acyl-phospholipid synthase-like methyltransferase